MQSNDDGQYWAHSCRDCKNENACYMFDYCDLQNCELDQVKYGLKNIDDAFDEVIDRLFDSLSTQHRRENDISI